MARERLDGWVGLGEWVDGGCMEGRQMDGWEGGRCMYDEWMGGQVGGWVGE